MTPFLPNSLQDPLITGGNSVSKPPHARNKKLIRDTQSFLHFFAQEEVVGQVTDGLQRAPSKVSQ